MAHRTAAALVGLALSVAACSEAEPVVDLATGECLAELPTQEFVEVEVVDCTTEHTAEVIHTAELDGGDFPGDAAVGDQATALCLEAFEPAVGEQYALTSLTLTPLLPTAETWETGDREVACMVHNADGTPLTAPVGQE